MRHNKKGVVRNNKFEKQFRYTNKTNRSNYLQLLDKDSLVYKNIL